MEKSTPILAFRWSVFILAVFYILYAAVFSNWSSVGGPLRYLTIWGLLLSGTVAFMVLRISRGRSNRRWDSLVATTAVINAMVVFLYWKLYFADPNSVTRDGNLDVWWREYYMHLVGPLLMWIDAVFINRVFRRTMASAATVIGVVLLYVAWIELIVSPFNAAPVGKVTSGLPYPFLNDLVFADRTIFYGVNLTVAIVFLLGFTFLAFLVRKAKAAEPV